MVAPTRGTGNPLQSKVSETVGDQLSNAPCISIVASLCLFFLFRGKAGWRTGQAELRQPTNLVILLQTTVEHDLPESFNLWCRPMAGTRSLFLMFFDVYQYHLLPLSELRQTETQKGKRHKQKHFRMLSTKNLSKNQLQGYCSWPGSWTLKVKDRYPFLSHQCEDIGIVFNYIPQL